LLTRLEKEIKEVNDRIKKNVLEVVANEYDSLINGVKQSEVNRQEKVDTWETAKENERLEKLRLEQERVDSIKAKISSFFVLWRNKIDVLQFADLENFEIEFGETLVNYDKSELQEFEVLFTDAVSNLTYMLSEKKSTLLAQENIRLEQIRLAEEREKQRIEAEKIAEQQRIEREKFEAEQKVIAEKNRIAQEKFLAEKREFEEKQAEAKYQERCEQNLKLEDAKNIKDLLGIEATTTDTMEVEFEEVENGKFANYHEEDVHEVATKGLSTRLKAGNLPIEKELTWEDLLLKFNWQKVKEGNTEPELSHFIKWLSENYNVPTAKI
jgi:hypothetical protein